MAFVPKEWKARLVEFAGRRTLTNVSTGETAVYDVARNEGAVSQEGDAFSAANMNDLETRISTEFGEINKKLSYSSNEIVIGTWIDDKTIYRKCFTGTFSNDEIVLTGVDTLINLHGSALLATKIRAIPFYQYYGGNEFCVTFQTESNNVKMVACDSGTGVSVYADFVLEYTKI